MAIAQTVESYMAKRGVRYDVIPHAHSHNSAETAQLAHVPGDRLAKSVILEDDHGFVMAVLPSTCHIRLGRLSREMNRRFRLATENALPNLFVDCELGAIPPVGLAYGMSTVIDEDIDARTRCTFRSQVSFPQ
jgi:Ala-tRNA(Pro) deacylase